MLSKLVVACLSISVSALGLRLFSLAHKAERFPWQPQQRPDTDRQIIRGLKLQVHLRYWHFAHSDLTDSARLATLAFGLPLRWYLRISL